jgi:hypothetical protein
MFLFVDFGMKMVLLWFVFVMVVTLFQIALNINVSLVSSGGADDIVIPNNAIYLAIL